ncbi:TDT family transporter [Nocardioides rotundus]|uniref:TDT family transporter n=1 Tax=Nocardioides rotundus TaxID=1774216 RepID=UPI001CBFDB37|nr:TDT family transporter [Nocardioides rotundus]UAL29672.1 TDT family transporter [Nocardioides rotundus]
MKSYDRTEPGTSGSGSAPVRWARLANIPPNWFASVMGTGILATSLLGLPAQVPGQRMVATAVWLLATLMLVVVTAATAGHWLQHRERARAHHRHPVVAHFYGAPPMAVLTVAFGMLLLGPDLVGTGPAVAVAGVLWVAGTVGGLVTAVAVPYLCFTEPRADRVPFAGWLMPVVPPMVSATGGGLLVPHLPAGELRTTLFLLSWSMFGLSLFASVVIITQVWGALMRDGAGPQPMVPTLWIVLGPLGQSITAAGTLGGVADQAVAPGLAQLFAGVGVVYGVVTLGFAVLWTAVALLVTLRSVRAGLPFALTWWSFTFPVGTCVTGRSVLWRETSLTVFAVLAVAYFLGLLVGWAQAATRSVHGTFVTGRLLA